MSNLHLSLHQGSLWWIYWQRGEEVWPGAVCRVLGPVVNLWLPGCTTLSFRVDLYLPLEQARVHNLQAALISTWLSEGPISTCTSSGCCTDPSFARDSVCHKTSGGGKAIASPLAAFFCLCWVKGAAMWHKSSSLGEKSIVLLHSCCPTGWSGKHGSNSSGYFDWRTF